MPTAFITGTAGFIGFHLAKNLLANGWTVSGYDGITPYYDVTLKKRRHAMLNANPNFTATEAMLEDDVALRSSIEVAEPDAIIHLAAQAGVRYSLENPRAYVDANLIGTFNLIEAARKVSVGHLLMASTSSVYGANRNMPFEESQQTDTPLTLYAATKKANESIAHSYAHLWNIPTTMFRFFSVYGTWGRPDLALYKFVKAFVENRPIDVYNSGQMARDFTFVDDLVNAIRLLIDAVPGDQPVANDQLSPVAPYRVVNIGNGQKIPLMEFIEALENALGARIEKNMLPMQPGDVHETWANTDLLETLTGYRPNTDVKTGIAAFVDWYACYYGVSLNQNYRATA